MTTIGGDYSDGQEFSYDDFGMLKHITGKFSGTNDSYFTSADYYYDNQHVLDSVNTAIPGINYAEGYTKTPVSGRYLLSKLYTLPSVNGFTDSNYTAALIDDSGRLAVHVPQPGLTYFSIKYPADKPAAVAIIRNSFPADIFCTVINNLP